MKLRGVRVNNRKRQIELETRSGRVFPVPFTKLEPRPTPTDRVAEAYVDRELASEAVTYRLESVADGPHRHALEYNRDPGYLADLLIHKLTVEAGTRVQASGLSRRELARRLGTSVAQLYRLLDPANTRKSFAQLVALLDVLDCAVEVTVRRGRRRSVCLDELATCCSMARSPSRCSSMSSCPSAACRGSMAIESLRRRRRKL